MSIAAVCLLSVGPVISVSVKTGYFHIDTLSSLVVNTAIAVIYFSRIARKEVRESKGCADKRIRIIYLHVKDDRRQQDASGIKKVRIIT